MLGDSRLARGVGAFNAGNFFEAHEIWEELWLESVGPERPLLQGLVQIAAGYAKVESGVRGGAIKLLARGLEHVRQFGPAAFRIAIGPFVDGVDADLQRLRAAVDGPVSLDLVRAPQLCLM
jgi:hypothetical protein